MLCNIIIYFFKSFFVFVINAHCVPELYEKARKEVKQGISVNQRIMQSSMLHAAQLLLDHGKNSLHTHKGKYALYDYAS